MLLELCGIPNVLLRQNPSSEVNDNKVEPSWSTFWSHEIASELIKASASMDPPFPGRPPLVTSSTQQSVIEQDNKPQIAPEAVSLEC